MAIKFDKFLGQIRESDVVSLDNIFKYKGTITVASDFPYLSSVSNADLYVVSGTVTDNDATRTNTGLTFYSNEEIAWLSGANTWEVVGSTSYAQFSELSTNFTNLNTTVNSNSANWNNTITKATSSILNSVALWANTSGTELKDSRLYYDDSLSGGTTLNIDAFSSNPLSSDLVSNDLFVTIISGQVFLNYYLSGSTYKVEMSV